MSAQILKSLKTPFVLWLYATMLFGCATSAPVQEMSNARQTIASAVEARADIYAPKHLETAESLMEQATEALESGDYALARKYAVSAQQYAVKARQQAFSNQK